MSFFPASILTMAGLACVAAGFDLPHRGKGFWWEAAALLAPLGVLMAAAGAVSLLVPEFFSS